MDDRTQRFIADDGWLFVAILTFALTSLAGIAGLGPLAGAITIVGWFLLTPVLLFWGEEVAHLLGGDDATASPRGGEADVETDPLEELKRRYAAGEINDAEFERRLERLVAVDEIPDDAVAAEPSVDDPTTDAVREDDPLERDREPER